MIGHKVFDTGAPMKLGIVTVYFVKGENKQLLDLHLSQIERYTDVLYTTYTTFGQPLEAPRFIRVTYEGARNKIYF
jgi:hypothetical protein